MRYFSREILIHRHWGLEVPLSHWFAFEEARDSMTFCKLSEQWDRKHLGISFWFLQSFFTFLHSEFYRLIFFLCLFEASLPEGKKHLSSGANQTILFTIWCTNRKVKVINWLIWYQHMRRSKDLQHVHFADPLRATFRTNRDFSLLYRLYVISYFFQFARDSKVPPQIPVSVLESFEGNS